LSSWAPGTTNQRNKEERVKSSYHNCLSRWDLDVRAFLQMPSRQTEQDVILLMIPTNLHCIRKPLVAIVGWEHQDSAVKGAEKSLPAPEDAAAALGVTQAAEPQSWTWGR